MCDPALIYFLVVVVNNTYIKNARSYQPWFVIFMILCSGGNRDGMSIFLMNLSNCESCVQNLLMFFGQIVGLMDLKLSSL